MQSNSTTEKFPIKKRGLSQNYNKVNKKSGKERDKDKKNNKKTAFETANEIYDKFIEGDNESVKYLKELFKEKEKELLNKFKRNQGKKNTISKKDNFISQFQNRSEVIINIFVKEHRRLVKESMQISATITDEELERDIIEKIELNNAQKEFAKNGYAPFRDIEKDTQALVNDLISRKCLN